MHATSALAAPFAESCSPHTLSMRGTAQRAAAPAMPGRERATSHSLPLGAHVSALSPHAALASQIFWHASPSAATDCIFAIGVDAGRADEQPKPIAQPVHTIAPHAPHATLRGMLPSPPPS